MPSTARSEEWWNKPSTGFYKDEHLTTIPTKVIYFPSSMPSEETFNCIREKKDIEEDLCEEKTSTYISKRKDIVGLSEIYNFENSDDINQFLLSHDTTLIEILYEAYEYIKKIFDSNITNLCIELYQDPEEDYEGLSVKIKTNLNPESSLDLLDEFYENFWLEIDSSFISIMVRPV